MIMLHDERVVVVVTAFFLLFLLFIDIQVHSITRSFFLLCGSLFLVSWWYILEGGSCEWV